MMARWQLPAKHCLYGPQALYYLGRMQCCGNLFSFLGHRRPLFFPWNEWNGFAPAAAERLCAGDFPGSPAGQV
jgi:hypothetical protein